MSDFSKVASALSRRTHDTAKDNSTDLDIAQASHALKILKEIALDEPDLVARALKIRPAARLFRRVKRKPESTARPYRVKRKRKARDQRKTRKTWSRFSTAYSRHTAGA